VLPEQVTILANEAEKPEEIDRAAAESLLAQGQELWSEAGEDAGKYSDALRIQAEAQAKLNASVQENH
jgi:F-type H+-transporting ATPase subunit epsilon